MDISNPLRWKNPAVFSRRAGWFKPGSCNTFPLHGGPVVRQRERCIPCLLVGLLPTSGLGCEVKCQCWQSVVDANSNVRHPEQWRGASQASRHSRDGPGLKTPRPEAAERSAASGLGWRNPGHSTARPGTTEMTINASWRDPGGSRCPHGAAQTPLTQVELVQRSAWVGCGQAELQVVS